MLSVKMYDGCDDISDAISVREEVFCSEQNIPIEIEIDEFDKSSKHIVVYYNGKPVGTARLVEDNGTYSIGRVAVLKDYRRRNIGALLVNNLKDFAFSNGVCEINIHAQVSAEEFYKKLGFKEYGGTFIEAGIEHINMNIRNSREY